MTLRPTISPTRLPTFVPTANPTASPHATVSLTDSFTAWILQNQIYVGAAIIAFFFIVSITIYLVIQKIKSDKLKSFNKNEKISNEEGSELGDFEDSKLDDNKEIVKNYSHDIPYEDIYGKKSKSWDENSALNVLNQKQLKDEFLKQYRENLELRTESNSFTEPLIDPTVLFSAESDKILTKAQLERLFHATKTLQEDNLSFQHANRFFNTKMNTAESNRPGRFFQNREPVQLNSRSGPPTTSTESSVSETNLQRLLSKFSTVSNVIKGSASSKGSDVDSNTGVNNSREDSPASNKNELDGNVSSPDAENGFEWPQETLHQSNHASAEDSSSLFNLVQRLSGTLATNGSNPNLVDYTSLRPDGGTRTGMTGITGQADPDIDLELSREEVRPADPVVRSRSNSQDSSSRFQKSRQTFQHIHQQQQQQQRTQSAASNPPIIIVGSEGGNTKHEVRNLLNKSGSVQDRPLII